MTPLYRFLRLYRPYRFWVFLSILLGSGTLLAQIGLLSLSGWFIAAMGIAGLAGSSMNYFTPAAIIRTLAILRTAGRYGERLVSHETTFRITSHFRSQLYRELNHRVAITETLHSADIFGRLRADVDRLERFFLLGFLPLCTASVGLVSVVAALLYFLPPLALIEAGVLIGAGVVLPLWLQRATARDHTRIAEQQAFLRQQLAETTSGMAEMAIYGQLAAQQETLVTESANLIAREKRLALSDALLQALFFPLMGLAVAAAFLCTSEAVAANQLPASFLAMLPLLCLAGFDAVLPLPLAWQQFPGARAAAARVFALLDAPCVQEGTNTVAAASFALRCTLPALPPRLNHATTLHLQAGEQVALVGPSGSGKTSLLHYLTGLLTPPAHTVFLNGTDVTQLQLAHWRRQFSVAEQHAYCFTGTVRENLLLAAPDASDAQLQAACEQVLLPLAAWREGLNTRLGTHGASLSGGERRRLTLARALLRPAPCLILDEPTEGLDKPMAEALMQTIRAHARAQNQAVLVITHDRALAAPMDRQLTILR